MFVRLGSTAGATPPPRDRVAEAERLRRDRGTGHVAAILKAGHGVPWGHVAAAYEELRAAGLPVDRIGFLGTQIPGAALRAAAVLPPVPPVAPVVLSTALELWTELELEEPEPQIPEMD
mgnify:CR=1 FL=1